MRSALLFLSFFHFLSVQVMAQHQGCGQPEIMENLLKAHPGWSQQIADRRKEMKRLAPGSATSKSTTAGPEYLIPVVFHVLHQGGVENISDAQIQDQIRILNRDYQKMNPDTSLIVQAFKNNIANVGFGFQLARIDPQGNCTNGITRHFTTKTNWDANNLNDFTYSWPRDKYLNIYVVKTLNISATAYSFLPEVPVPASADAIVSMHNMIGSIGTGTIANSRVITHEVGHWFGLQHIWGTSNQPGVTCGDDLVEDTPITKGFLTCATSNTGICNPGTPENVQNYMDYAPCKIMFTNGQAERMRGVLTGTVNNRNNLYSEENLVAAGISGGSYACNPTAGFTVSSRRNCANENVVFTSFSQTGSGPVSRLWFFQGGLPETSTDSIPVVVYPNPGTYPVKLQISNGSGSVTENKENFIQIANGSQGDPIPYSCDFESDAQLPSLLVFNPDPNTGTWEQNVGTGAITGNKCFYLNSFNFTSNRPGEKDGFELPPFNLAGFDDLNLSFYYAYARLDVAQRDSFKVQYSLDCGANWTSFAGLPTITQMAAGSGGTLNDEFTPTAEQWVQIVIPRARLTAIAGQNGVRIRFLFVKDINKPRANNFFVDQIQFTGTFTSNRKQITGSPFLVYPNPVIQGPLIVRSSAGLRPGAFKATLFDVHGKARLSSVEERNPGEYVVNSGHALSKGIYTLELSHQGDLYHHKIVVQ